MYRIETVSHNVHGCVRYTIFFWLFCFFGISAISTVTKADQPFGSSATLEVGTVLPTMEELETQIEQLRRKKDTEASDEQRRHLETAIGNYEQAKTRLLEAQKLETAVIDFQEARTEAPERLAIIKAQLEQIPAEPNIEESVSEWPVTQIEQHLAQLEAELAGAKKNALDSEAEAKKRAARRLEIPEVSVRVKEQLENVRRDLGTKSGPDVAADLAHSERILLLLAEQSLTKDLEFYQEEILSYDARGDLLGARRDLAVRQVARYEKLVKRWQDILTKKRGAEAEQAVEKARQASLEAAQSHPVVRTLAKENMQLAELRTGPQGLVATNAAKVADLETLDRQLTELESDFQSVIGKVKVAGLTDVIGVILLGKRNDLPNVQRHQRNIKTRRLETSKARFEWIKYDEQYAELADIETSVGIVLKDLEPSLDQAQPQDIGAEIRQLLATRRELLKALVGEYDIYLGQLADLDVMERRLVAKTEEYANYIDENILWVKNSKPLNLSTFPQTWETAVWLLGPQRWWQVLLAVGRDLRTAPLVYGVAAILFTALFLSKHRLADRVREVSDLVYKKYSDRFVHSYRVLASSVILAAFFPAVLFFLGWRLALTDQESEFVNAAAAGFRASAFIYLVLAFVRVISLPKGLAVAHFRIPEHSMSFVGQHVSWFMACIVPLVFAITAIEQQVIDTRKDSLGRLAFIAALSILSVFFVILIRPYGRLMKSVLEQKRGGWLDRLRHIWFLFFVILPLALALSAALGYYYAAQQLAGCLQATILWILCLLIVFGLTMRWLTVTQNRLALKREQQRLAAPSAEDKADREAGNTQPAEDALSVPDEDLYEISLKMRQFMGTFFALALFVGLWIIWNDVLPAFGIFNRVELWKTTVAEKAVIITLADLSLALITIFITIVAARNVPGLLELVVLRCLPLDQGVRFAIVTLARYIIVVVGVVIAFGEIGLGWSKVQWLVAAMTVGLGFGLQEIFANFVSGLIILFEQPMRVGDMVTVGDINGRVTRIRIRATTILKWDRKELIVPNKEFITGRLINWTLSDTILRMKFAVGIAYGSDTAFAEKALLEVAHNNPKVLRDPEPFVIFKAFGNSALEFELRLYIPDLDNYITVWHETNRAIDDAFRKAGIVIAFPQRDLHVRSIEPLIPIEIKQEEKRPR